MHALLSWPPSLRLLFHLLPRDDKRNQDEDEPWWDVFWAVEALANPKCEIRLIMTLPSAETPPTLTSFKPRCGAELISI
jgi:hypothetical protein